jgi:hypothetical protein
LDGICHPPNSFSRVIGAIRRLSLSKNFNILRLAFDLSAQREEMSQFWINLLGSSPKFVLVMPLDKLASRLAQTHNG